VVDFSELKTSCADMLPDFPQEEVFNREHLVEGRRRLGMEWARELFRRFGWDPAMATMERIRAEFR
jgi:hypothetical protein